MALENEKPPVSWRAARTIDIISEKHPDLLIPWMKKMINSLDNNLHPGIHRIFLHIFTREINNLNDDQKTFLLDHAFSNLAIAIKSYSMDILLKLSKNEPGFLYEIKALLETVHEDLNYTLKRKAKKLFKIAL